MQGGILFGFLRGEGILFLTDPLVTVDLRIQRIHFEKADILTKIPIITFVHIADNGKPVGGIRFSCAQ